LAELKKMESVAMPGGQLLLKEIRKPRKGKVVVSFGDSEATPQRCCRIVAEQGPIDSQKKQMSTTKIHPSAVRRWWQGIDRKPVGEIALELTLFVLGVVILYAIDLTVISRGAPIAIQYFIDLVVYLNHHAVAAIETLY
jgi:hypothetical protein